MKKSIHKPILRLIDSETIRRDREARLDKICAVILAGLVASFVVWYRSHG